MAQFTPNFGVALIGLSGLTPKFGVNYSEISFIILGPVLEVCPDIETVWICKIRISNHYYSMLQNLDLDIESSDIKAFK